MLVEFYRPSEEDEEPVPEVLATATWNGSSVAIEAADPKVRAALEDVFRATPVVVDDASLRTLGTHGEVVLQPGSAEWFRAAAIGRTSQHGLAARFVPGVRAGGFDPAGQYMSFGEAIGLLEKSEG